MKNSKRVFSWMRVVAVACLAWCVGCNTTADYTLGGELTPGHQQMDIYHRHYKGGEYIDALFGKAVAWVELQRAVGIELKYGAQ